MLRLISTLTIIDAHALVNDSTYWNAVCIVRQVSCARCVYFSLR